MGCDHGSTRVRRETLVQSCGRAAAAAAGKMAAQTARQEGEGTGGAAMENALKTRNVLHLAALSRKTVVVIEVLFPFATQTV